MLFASDTASTFPITLQLSLHTGAPKSFSNVLFHSPPGSFCVQMKTLLSCPQLAMVFIGRPMFTLQHTSLTQSPCALSWCSSFHPALGSNLQIFARLSHPPVTRRFTGVADAPPAATKEPGGGAGAHDTEVHPMECAP